VVAGVDAASTCASEDDYYKTYTNYPSSQRPEAAGGSGEVARKMIACEEPACQGFQKNFSSKHWRNHE
jgi:hypothetical protein